MTDADIKAAGESELAVGDHDFAMCAHVHGHHSPKREGGQETRVTNALFTQSAEDGGQRVTRPGGIDQDADFFPYLTLLHGLEDARSTVIWAEDVLSLLDRRTGPRSGRARG